MLFINKIPLDYMPRQAFLSTLIAPPNEPDMSEFDSAFLCGLLNKFRPKKILEVGVAAGGTTGVILNCLENIGQKYRMMSVDIDERYYRDNNYPCGFLAYEITKNLQVGTHEFQVGTILPFVIDDFGDDIDFLILDTIHRMPGENLDFLTALPYLKKNAVICMHDVSMDHRFQSRIFHATTALFSSVIADKILNFELNDSLHFKYPNIAAFQINDDTLKNIENVFLALILRWDYILDYKNLKGYTEMIMRHYPAELFAIYREAIRLNVQSLLIESKR